MKHYILAAFSALFILACGEVGDGGYGKPGSDLTASCGGIPYYPSTSFCFEEKIGDFCEDDLKYDPDVYGCLDNIKRPKCGGTTYNDDEYFCAIDSIYLKCENKSKSYNPESEFCFADIKFTKCNGKIWNYLKEFCSGNEIYLLCDGTQPYDPPTQICFFNSVKSKCKPSRYDDEYCDANGVSYRICGNKEYESAKKFCFNAEIYQRCGVELKEYEPAKEFCHSDGSVYPRCGGSMYNPVNDFCFDNKIYSKCSTPRDTYNPKESFCDEQNMLYTLCNGIAYKPAQEFCSDYKILPKCDPSDPLYDRYNPRERICSKDVPYTGKDFLYYVCANGEISKNAPINGICSDTYKICRNELYKTATNFCFKDAIYDKCGTRDYDPSMEFCFTDNNVYLKCRVKIGVNDFGVAIYEYKNYNPEVQRCNDGVVEDKGKSPVCLNLLSTEFCCFGQKYDQGTSNYFCYKNELYPRCGKKPTYIGNDTISYNPLDTACFEGGLYNRCTNDGITGICVDNTLKRCKQLGSGLDHIVDPLPGMKCDSNGAITGTSNSGNYPIAQIGSQVWMRKNIALIRIDNQEWPDTLKKYLIKIGSTVWSEQDLSRWLAQNLSTWLTQHNAWLTEHNITVANISSAKECYNDSIANCTKHGSLYDWADAMVIPASYNTALYVFPSNVPWQGPCPAGFYMPTDEDWKKLMEYTGGTSIAGGRLKDSLNWNGLNAYGFDALPGGYYNEVVTGGYRDIGSRAMWWSLTQPLPNNVRNASYWTIISADTELRNHNQDKALHKAYVRCLHY